jgi:transposase
MDYHIKNEEWEGILSFLRSISGLHTRNDKQLRRFIEGVWYILRTGCQWRLLPSHYGHWRTVHKRFKLWCVRGIWEQLFCSVQKEPDLEHVMIDTTIVRAHSCSAGLEKNSGSKEALGRSKGGFTTKIHALVDGLGNPLKFRLTPGQCHDVTQSYDIIENIYGSTVIADKGYDANSLVTQLEAQECQTVIPSRKNRKNPRKHDTHLYKERHLIECFFGKMKHYRRVFSRFDKSASVFFSFLCLVGALIWLR